MSRRVIFPDPDIWTRKEHPMTDQATPTNAADYRRAAALTVHHRQGNPAGVVAIIDETNTTGRAAHLLLATLGLHHNFIATLRTRDGINLMADYIHGIATLDPTESPGTEICRAARILECHGLQDLDGIDHEIRSAIDDQRATETFIALLDHYEVALPELSSNVGIGWIQDHITALANEEAQDQ
ncbi:hypothetical protein [Mycolicibacterium alvei]|uniref:Uncharacterized protein n=1 Tax=Mycolicibacterium alvei TaxID=67081 RepID=A0A6N4V0A2_9MYCO|nr:hypothetical protein [Mycolicibacterium alvei]MCV7000294.1 hypothetical protein [Mycolicibacterium alvei]BBX29317.1 hypothetical protein MALV_44420 [Mycolicibacterium alvei]